MEQNNPNIIDVTADTFMAEVIECSKQIPVLLDFWAEWCAPCKNLAPILESLVEKHPGAFVLAKVNTDQEQALSMQMGVQSLPTVALLKDGQIVDNFMGLKPESEIKAWMAAHVDLDAVAEPEPVQDLGVQALIDAGDFEQALAALVNLPEDQAVWQTIEVHALMGNTDAAQKMYDKLSDEQLKQVEADVAKAQIQLANVQTDDVELNALKKQIAAGDMETAVQQLLDRLQKQVGDADVKQLLIACFGLMDDPKIVAKYRRKMASLLF